MSKRYIEPLSGDSQAATNGRDSPKAQEGEHPISQCSELPVESMNATFSSQRYVRLFAFIIIAIGTIRKGTINNSNSKVKGFYTG